MAQSDGLEANVGQLYHNSEADITTAFMGVFEGESYLGGAVVVIDHADETGVPVVHYVPQKARWENRPGIVSDKSHLYITRERPSRRDDNCEVVQFDSDLTNEAVIYSARTGCSVMGVVTIGDIDYLLINQQHPTKRNLFGGRSSPRNVSIMVLKVIENGEAEIGSNSSGEYTNSTGFLVIPGRGFVKAANPADHGVVPDPSTFLAYRPSDLSDNTYRVFDNEQDAITYVLGDADINPIRDALSSRDARTASKPRFSTRDLISPPEDIEGASAAVRDSFAAFKFVDGVDLRGEAVGLPLRSQIAAPIPYNRYQYRSSIPFGYEESGTLDLSEIKNFIPQKR